MHSNLIFPFTWSHSDSNPRQLNNYFTYKINKINKKGCAKDTLDVNQQQILKVKAEVNAPLLQNVFHSNVSSC